MKYFDAADDRRRFRCKTLWQVALELPTVSPASRSPSECVSNDVCVSLGAAHQEAPGASIHVSPNWIRSSLSHSHKHHQQKKKTCNSGSKADLLQPVFSLRAVLMVQWLKAVLMHHTSYLASVSFTFVPLDRCCFRPRPAGGAQVPQIPLGFSLNLKGYGLVRQIGKNQKSGVAPLVPLSAWIDATLDVRDRATK